jgi:hypothetical protein
VVQNGDARNNQTVKAEGVHSLDNRGEVCLEEEVERRREAGMSAGEIARDMGVDPGWVEALISAWGDSPEDEY